MTKKATSFTVVKKGWRLRFETQKQIADVIKTDLSNVLYLHKKEAAYYSGLTGQPIKTRITVTVTIEDA